VSNVNDKRTPQDCCNAANDSKFSPHQCDDSRGEGKIKLACGYMMSVIVAGALSPDGQVKLKE